MNNESEKPLEVSALIVIRKKGTEPSQILNVLAHNKNRYGFPGGKLEAGESPKEAVIRETNEELGVTPASITYRATYEALTPEGRGIKMHVFTGEVPENITPANEIAELYWLTYNQMAANQDLLTPITIQYILPLLKSLE